MATTLPAIPRDDELVLIYGRYARKSGYLARVSQLLPWCLQVRLDTIHPSLPNDHANIEHCRNQDQAALSESLTMPQSRNTNIMVAPILITSQPTILSCTTLSRCVAVRMGQEDNLNELISLLEPCLFGDGLWNTNV